MPSPGSAKPTLDAPQQPVAEGDACAEVFVVPASFSQQRMWFLNELWPASGTYNVPAVLRLNGKLDIGILQRALARVVARHETLRTNFIVEDGEILQLIHPQRVIAISVHERHVAPNSEDNGSATPAAEQSAFDLVDELVTQPFSLDADPLLRIDLIELNESEQLLVVVLHHIVADEWSLSVLFRELSTQLEAILSGAERQDASPLAIQYADYAVWQREQFENHAFDRQLEYWKTQFETPPAVLELPSDRPRPAIQTFHGAHHSFEVPAEVSVALLQYSRSQNATLFMVLLAAYNVLLHRFSGQTDIVVGCPIANRNRPELEGLIGLFLNTVLLRSDVADDPTFEALVRRVRSAALGAFSNQDIPFEQLVEELQPPRNASHAPLFQTMMTFQNSPYSPPEFPGCTTTTLDPNRDVSRFDLSLYLEDAGGKLVGEFEFNTDLFDAATVRRFEQHFQVLLRAIPDSSDRPISQIPMIPQGDLQQFASWNATQKTFETESIVQLISQQALNSPAKVAVSSGSQELSYAELEQRSNAIADALIGLGVGRGTLVGICLERSVEMVSWLLGVLKCGGAYVPIDPHFPADRQRYIASDSQLGVLVTQQDFAATFDGFDGRILRIEDDLPISTSEPQARPHTDENQPAYVIYTSGSTGKPKGVVIPHRAMKNFLLSMREQPGLSQSATLLSITTLSFDISVLEIFLPLVVGARLVIATRDDAMDGVKLTRMLEEQHVDVMQGTPASWQLLVDSGWTGTSNLRMLCGGEALPRELANDLLDRGQELWNLYGPTETTVWSAIGKVARSDQDISLGVPIANTQLVVLSDRLQPVPIGVAGNLYIGGVGLALGYLHRDDLTAEKFLKSGEKQLRLVAAGEIDRLYDTGDVARRRLDGTLEFLGRRDHQVKIRGYRIELGEIEQGLVAHEHVAQAVVVAKALRSQAGGGRNENALVAYVIPEATTSPSPRELRDWLRSSLPDYMLPAHFVFLDEFPQTPNRKVDRRALPDPYIDSPAAFDIDSHSARDDSARDDIEQQLVNIWKSVLGLKRVGLQQDFFELGGNSLAAARMMVALEKVQGQRLPLALLLQAPTIDQLAAVIRERGWKPAWRSLVPISPGGRKTPLYCIHAAGGNVLLYRELAGHLGKDRPIYGLQSDALASDFPQAKTVEEMAAAYVAEIQNIQPSGPYHVCGYCLGGTIAYEVAQQLRRAGDQVGVVALFDTHSRWHQVSAMAQVYSNMQKIAFHVGNVILSGPKGIGAFLAEKVREGNRRLSRRFAAGATKLAHRLGLRQAQPVAMLEGIYDHATEVYEPQAFDGRLVVFKPRTAYIGYQDDHLGWRELAEDLQVIQLPVYPAGMLLEPFVSQLAQQLESELAAFE